MHIMCLIIIEENAEIQDQYPLSLNRDRDRLQKYWAIIFYCAFLHSIGRTHILGVHIRLRYSLFLRRGTPTRTTIQRPILQHQGFVVCFS